MMVADAAHSFAQDAVGHRSWVCKLPDVATNSDDERESSYSQLMQHAAADCTASGPEAQHNHCNDILDLGCSPPAGGIAACIAPACQHAPAGIHASTAQFMITPRSSSSPSSRSTCCRSDSSQPLHDILVPSTCQQAPQQHTAGEEQRQQQGQQHASHHSPSPAVNAMCTSTHGQPHVAACAGFQPCSGMLQQSWWLRRFIRPNFALRMDDASDDDDGEDAADENMDDTAAEGLIALAHAAAPHAHASSDNTGAPHQTLPQPRQQQSDQEVVEEHLDELQQQAAEAVPAGAVCVRTDTSSVVVVKAMTKSDALTRRLILPRICIEANLPEAVGQGSFDVIATDMKGREWQFVLRSWSNGHNPKPVYVLEHIADYMKEYGVGEGDVMGICRSEAGGFVVEHNTPRMQAAAVQPGGAAIALQRSQLAAAKARQLAWNAEGSPEAMGQILLHLPENFQLCKRTPGCSKPAGHVGWCNNHKGFRVNYGKRGSSGGAGAPKRRNTRPRLQEPAADGAAGEQQQQ